MTAGNSFDAEPTLFSALLTPHRSLSRSGFLLLMAFIVLISFIAGLVFLSMGAWPVFGFFGIDALAIYWAFKVNFHRAAAYEEIVVTPSAVHVRRVTHLGAVSEWTFNPLWVRLDIEADEEFGVRTAFAGLPRTQPGYCELSGSGRKTELCQRLNCGAEQRQTWHRLQSHHLRHFFGA